MTRISSAMVPVIVIAATILSACELADEQVAAMDKKRHDCAAAGGYFEDNKPGEPDNYTCKGLADGEAAGTLPAPPTQCRTKETTVQKADGSVETRSSQVCSSL